MMLSKIRTLTRVGLSPMVARPSVGSRLAPFVGDGPKYSLTASTDAPMTITGILARLRHGSRTTTTTGSTSRNAPSAYLNVTANFEWLCQDKIEALYFVDYLVEHHKQELVEGGDGRWLLYGPKIIGQDRIELKKKFPGVVAWYTQDAYW